MANKRLKARLKSFILQLKVWRRKGNVTSFLEERIAETKLQLKKNRGLHYASPLRGRRY